MKPKWRADEMEMSINFRAMRLSWLFGTTALVVWSLESLVRSGSLRSVPFMILIVQNTIFFCSKLIMTHKAVGNGGKED